MFKTLSEQHLGDLSLIRLYSGTLEPGKELLNTTRNRSEKLGALYHLVGKERIECKSATAGDIVAAVKLKETHTGDTLADKSRPVKLAPPDFPGPGHRRVHPRQEQGRRGEDGAGPEPPARGGPDVQPRTSRPAPRRRWCYGMGDLQLEVMVDRLKKRFGVEVVLSRPHVPYRETITRQGRRASTATRSRPAGAASSARCTCGSSRCSAATGFEFVDEVKGGVVPNQYIPAVEKGVIAGMETGPLAGYPVVDVQVGAVLRQVPRRRLVGNGVQDRGRDLLPPGACSRPRRSCSSRSTRSRCACPRSSWAT